MLRVTDNRVEIDDAIEGAPSTNPLVHSLALRFPLRREVRRAFKGKQGGAIYFEAMSSRPFDNLAQADNDVVGADLLLRKWAGGAVGRVAADGGQSKIVGSLEYDHGASTG